MKDLTLIKQVHVPSACFELCFEHFRELGTQHLEGFALLIGKVENELFQVTEAMIPNQDNAVTPHGLLVAIAGNELFRINKYLFENQLRLIAQVHSHPQLAYHSEMDDLFPVATQEGAFSIVVPNFGAVPVSIASCAVFRLGQASWNHLLPDQAIEIFRII